MGANGCKSVTMGEDTCISNGENKNKAKRTTDGRAGHVLQCLVKDRKKEEIGSEENGRQEAHWGTITGQQGAFGQGRYMYQNYPAQIHEKENKKNQYTQAKNMQPVLF